MTWRPTLGAVILMALAAVALFWIFQRQIAGPSPVFHLPDDILPALEQSLEDQKELAVLDSASEGEYRARFEELQTTVGRLRILEHNRDRLVRRYELVLLGLLALSVALATLNLAIRHSALMPRLRRVQAALSELADGRGPVTIGDGHRDGVGQISRMIEATSVEITRDRRRLRALRNLSRWQDAAKRHAHEMRTPLGGARLTLDRLQKLLRGGEGVREHEIESSLKALGFELDRLGRFTEEFASFARLRPPQLRRENLGDLVQEFAATYEEAWPNLVLEVGGETDVEVSVDRAALRQVLANLCDNSSKSLGVASGRVEMRAESSEAGVRLLVSDDGPGIPDEIRERLFEPYSTTRGVGEGMGLGLAISLKILLDHGGDLELLDSSPGGSTFALTLPHHPPA